MSVIDIIDPEEFGIYQDEDCEELLMLDVRTEHTHFSIRMHKATVLGVCIRLIKEEFEEFFGVHMHGDWWERSKELTGKRKEKL